jgi:modulator of FtsH protease
MENYDRLMNPSSNKTNPKPSRNPYLYWGLIIIQFVIIYVLATIVMPSWAKLLLFSLFSFFWGIMLSTLSLDPNLIRMALTGTMSIFGLMIFIGVLLILFGVYLNYQFAFGLFIALLFLIISQIIMLFTGTSSLLIKAFSAIGLVIFSLYIIYDTNTILQRNYSGDFITASMDYYLDILNIFLDLINFNN